MWCQLVRITDLAACSCSWARRFDSSFLFRLASRPVLSAPPRNPPGLAAARLFLSNALVLDSCIEDFHLVAGTNQLTKVESAVPAGSSTAKFKARQGRRAPPFGVTLRQEERGPTAWLRLRTLQCRAHTSHRGQRPWLSCDCGAAGTPAGGTWLVLSAIKSKNRLLTAALSLPSCPRADTRKTACDGCSCPAAQEARQARWAHPRQH